MDGIRIDISNTFEQHDNFSDAKIACANDSNCIAIYEAFCDKNGPFMLLKNSFVVSVYGTDCIYKKKRYGKSLRLAFSYKTTFSSKIAYRI